MMFPRGALPYDRIGHRESTRALQRLQVAEQCWNQLRDRRMDRHGSLQHRAGRLGIHYIEDAVDDLVTPGPEKGGTQDILALSADQHLHEALGFTLFDRAADAAHRALGDQRRLSATSHLTS